MPISDNIIPIVLITITALFLGYFYTAPPIRLVARNGLGEISIFTVFGPLMVLGTGFAIFNDNFLASSYFNDLLFKYSNWTSHNKYLNHK